MLKKMMRIEDITTKILESNNYRVKAAEIAGRGEEENDEMSG